MSEHLLGSRYRILGTLGEGGMATVYRCRDESLNTEWAVKEFSPPAGNLAPDLIEQFRMEAHLLARLRHPGLPRVIDFFAENERFYLVMDHIPGVSLRQRLEQPVEQALAIQWLASILEVLEYLHGQEPPIIFRDLSPSNVMVEPDGTLKLIDFGLARLLEPQGKTRPALRGYGSSGYAPPEQYGHSSTDVRTDLYAVAAIAYHLFRGSPPPDAVAVMLGREKVTAPAVSAPLRAWVLRGLRSQAEERFPSAAHMRTELMAAAAAPSNDAADGCEEFARRLGDQLAPFKWRRLPAVPTVAAAFGCSRGLWRQQAWLLWVPRLGEDDMAAAVSQARDAVRSQRGMRPKTTFVVLVAGAIPNPVAISALAKAAGDGSLVVVAVDLGRRRVVDDHVGHPFSDTNNLADFLLNLRIATTRGG